MDCLPKKSPLWRVGSHFACPGSKLYVLIYRKISKISPGAYISQRLFLRGLFLEGLMYRRKFVFKNRLG